LHAALRSLTGDDEEFLRGVLGIPLVRASPHSHPSRTFPAENNYMSSEEFAVLDTQRDQHHQIGSVWVETRWGLAAVVIAACLVGLGGFYYFAACMTTK
jgi:hypothetical protein